MPGEHAVRPAKPGALVFRNRAGSRRKSFRTATLHAPKKTRTERRGRSRAVGVKREASIRLRLPITPCLCVQHPFHTPRISDASPAHAGRRQYEFQKPSANKGLMLQLIDNAGYFLPSLIDATASSLCLRPARTGLAAAFRQFFMSIHYLLAHIGKFIHFCQWLEYTNKYRMLTFHMAHLIFSESTAEYP